MQQVTLITGGSRGIGAAVARLCGAAGHAVAVNYQSNAAAAEATCAAVEAAGGTAMPVQADTGVEAEIMAMFAAVDDRFGPLTGLVNNAGIHGPRGRLDALSADAINRVLQVNVTGYFICAREAVKRMSTNSGGAGGAIVNVSSGSARLGGAGEGVLYAASKGGILSLTKAIAAEYPKQGIRANAVCPGGIATPLHGQFSVPDGADLDLIKKAVPFVPYVGPEWAASVVAFLASEDACYMNGTALRVDGGALP